MVNTVDWQLLVFLLLFLNVKMAVKVVAIVIIYLLQPNFKFGFRLKNSRLPLFYIIAIILGVFNWIVSGLFTKLNYDVIFLTGVSFWLLSILAIHQVKLSVEKNDTEIIHRTIFLFFILNAIVSLITFATIAWQTGTINPFQYQGEFQKYYIGTGDYIKGITMDTSTTNAVINAFGIFYFLTRKNILPCLLCMLVLLLTGSNFTNILFSFALVYVFIFQTNKDQKSLIVACIMLLVIFLVKVSPQNEQYIFQWYKDYFKKEVVYQPINSSVNPPTQSNIILTDDEIKQKTATTYLDSVDKASNPDKQYKIIGNLSPAVVSQVTGKPEIPKPDINSAPFQHKQDTTETQRTLLNFIVVNRSALKLSSKDDSFKPKYPGKILALQQTVNYLKQYPDKTLTGTGIGNFSSKLAFRGTAMKIAGGYPEKYAYLNNDFKTNHFDLYLYYFSRLDNLHSLTNSPNSVYDQLLAEYGLLGLLCFFIFYLWFFAKHYKKLTYGIPILLIMAGAFFIEYWFEQLSVVIIFELLLLLNIKETKTKDFSVQ